MQLEIQPEKPNCALQNPNKEFTIILCHVVEAHPQLHRQEVHQMSVKMCVFRNRDTETELCSYFKG